MSKALVIKKIYRSKSRLIIINKHLSDKFNLVRLTNSSKRNLM